MCVCPVRESVLRSSPPINFKQEVRGGGSCMLGVDSRAWEGKYNPFPKKILLPKIFSPKIFSSKIFSPKIFSSKIFSSKIFSPKIFSPKILPSKKFSQKIFLSKIFSQKIFSSKIFFKKKISQNFFWTKYCCQKYFHQKYFPKKIHQKYFRKNTFCFCQIFFKKKVGAKPLCCPQGLGWYRAIARSQPSLPYFQCHLFLDWTIAWKTRVFESFLVRFSTNKQLKE